MLYVTNIRPKLEFAVQAWSPHLKTDIAILEQVQHRATKTISSIKHFSYEERLRKLGLTTLEVRRIRGDIIEQYKITNEISFYVPHHQPASQITYNMRGHSHRLNRQNVQEFEERHNFFTNRVVAPWNLLSQNTVDAPSLNAVKNRISSK